MPKLRSYCKTSKSFLRSILQLENYATIFQIARSKKNNHFYANECFGKRVWGYQSFARLSRLLAAPQKLIEAKSKAMKKGFNQYAPMQGYEASTRKNR
jgi:hypothetical protein